MMTEVSPTEAIQHKPPTLDLDDAFRDEDDDSEFVFSRDTLRKEIAQALPPPSSQSWESDSVNNTASTTGAFFRDSISTLDISNNHENGYNVGGEWTSPTLESPLSTHFSQISLTPSVDIHSPKFSQSSEIKEEEPAEETQEDPEPHPYPNVIIDVTHVPNHPHRVTLTSEFKPAPYPPPDHESESNIMNGAAKSAGVVATAAEALPPAPSSAPSSFPPTAGSSPLPSSSSLPDSTAPNNLLQEKINAHKPTRSLGPSAFEKVRSKTRPTFLPPKSRKEDEKHMADWQQMMKQSRIAAEKRRKALQERRMQRERAIEESLHIWEKQIVPDWKVVHKDTALRKLWWRGIPTKLRATMWEKAVGNPLSLSKDHFRICLTRAKRALEAGLFPKDTLELLEHDVETTLPSLHIFHPQTGPLYGDLKDMLYAWVVARTDEGLGYTQGAARVAAMLLLNIPIQTAFIVMRNLLERHCMRSFFGGERTREDVEAYYRIFDTLLADGMPKIYFNFKQHQISPASYLPDWIIPLFLDHLPFEACARIWDVLLLEGDSFLYRAALGILAVLEPRLFFPDRKELLELLKGENKAALEVARREGAPLDGGKYEIYGVDEETLWERIDLMDDWWKESTWTRLIQRELPDS